MPPTHGREGCAAVSWVPEGRLSGSRPNVNATRLVILIGQPPADAAVQRAPDNGTIAARNNGCQPGAGRWAVSLIAHDGSVDWSCVRRTPAPYGSRSTTPDYPGCAGSFEQLVAQGAGRQELLGGAGKVSCSPELRAEPPVRSNASRLGYSAITMTSLATPTTGVQMVLTAQPLTPLRGADLASRSTNWRNCP